MDIPLAVIGKRKSCEWHNTFLNCNVLLFVPYTVFNYTHNKKYSKINETNFEMITPG